VLAVALPAAAQNDRAPKGLSLAAEGAFVVDTELSHVWPRCTRGQVWDGRSCSGMSLQSTQREALDGIRADAMADGFTCRLPTAAELIGLIKKSAKQREADAQFLPEPTGPAWLWTRTASIDSASVNQYDYTNVMRGRNSENVARVDAFHAMVVQWPTGTVRKDITKATKLPARVVCEPGKEPQK